MIYLIFGDEKFLIKEEIDKIIAKSDGASVEKLDSPDPATLVELISLPSLFFGKRLIIIYQYDFSLENDSLIESTNNLPNDLTLVFREPQNMDRRSKLYKALEKKSKILEFKSCSPWEEAPLVSFVIERFKKNGKEIKKEDAYILVDGVGLDMLLLDSEIQKISTYLGEEKNVDREAIETLMIKSGWDYFSFVNSFFDRNIRASISILDRLLKDREDPVKLLSFFSAQVRSLFKVKILAQQGLKPFEISKALKKSSSYYVNRLFDISSKFKTEEIYKTLNLAYEADLKLKRGYDPKTEMCLMLTESI